MQIFGEKSYTERLTRHYNAYYGMQGKRLTLTTGLVEKLHKDFFVLEFPPNARHKMFCYCTVGMSADRHDDNLIELVMYSPKQAASIVELMTACASHHRNVLPLNLHHTLNIGQPWVDNSKCDHGFISLPYLDGQSLEIFNFDKKEIHCYWLIPITETERDYKIDNGWEALEQLFEDNQLDYLNPERDSLVV